MPQVETSLSKNASSNAPSRPARKLNRRKVTQLAQQGVPVAVIAAQQDVAVSTVRRFLSRVSVDRSAVKDFKAERADALAAVGAEALECAQILIASIREDCISGALKPGAKPLALGAINAFHGTSYDKERLERGESTANISTVSRMVDSSVSGLYKAPNNSLNTQSESVSSEKDT